MSRAGWIAGGLVAGGAAFKFVPPPVVMVGLFVALSYWLVRLVLWAARWTIERSSRVQVRLANLHFLSARRRMAEVFALADARIFDLKRDLASAEGRVGELEA